MQSIQSGIVAPALPEKLKVVVYKRQGKGRLVMVFVTLNVNYYEILILINEIKAKKYFTRRQLCTTDKMKKRKTYYISYIQQSSKVTMCACMDALLPKRGILDNNIG